MMPTTDEVITSAQRLSDRMNVVLEALTEGRHIPPGDLPRECADREVLNRWLSVRHIEEAQEPWLRRELEFLASTSLEPEPKVQS